MCSASVSARASRGGGRAVTSEDTDAAAALPVQMAVTASQMAARQRDSISFGSETTHTRARARVAASVTFTGWTTEPTGRRRAAAASPGGRTGQLNANQHDRRASVRLSHQFTCERCHANRITVRPTAGGRASRVTEPARLNIHPFDLRRRCHDNEWRTCIVRTYTT